MRSRLRKYGHGCAAVGLSPQLSEKNWGGEGWLEKVGWASDGLLSMGAFTGMRQEVRKTLCDNSG